jgi:hypothetical protein
MAQRLTVQETRHGIVWAKRGVFGNPTELLSARLKPR